MDISFNTENREAAVGLRAMQQYKAKQFNEAIGSFTEILDFEPQNWDARLLLAASYYKSNQYYTAQRIFTFIAESCPDREIAGKAREALRSTKAQLEHGSTTLPPEFGCYELPGIKGMFSSWLDDCA